MVRKANRVSVQHRERQPKERGWFSGRYGIGENFTIIDKQLFELEVMKNKLQSFRQAILTKVVSGKLL